MISGIIRRVLQVLTQREHRQLYWLLPSVTLLTLLEGVGIATTNTDSNMPRICEYRQLYPDVLGDERRGGRTLPRGRKADLNAGEGAPFVETGSMEHVAVVYRATDVFVLASHCGGFGFLTPEDVANGTPVVFSNPGCLPEVASASVLFYKPTAASLADAVQRTIVDASTRAEGPRAATFMRSASAESHSEIVGEVSTWSAQGPKET